MVIGRIAAGTFLGLVVLGAAGGHNYHWIQKRKDRFNTAQLYHAVAGLGMWMSRSIKLPLYRNIAAGLFLAGLLGFSGPLYYMVFKDDENFPLKKAMPVGGLSMMLGFGLIMLFI